MRIKAKILEDGTIGMELINKTDDMDEELCLRENYPIALLIVKEEGKIR